MLTNWNKIITIRLIKKGCVLKPFSYQKAMMPEIQVKLIHALMSKYIEWLVLQATRNNLIIHSKWGDYRVEKRMMQT